MVSKKTLRDIYFDFIKLLEEKQKLVVSSEELSNILNTTSLMINILLKALRNSKEISLIEKGDIYEIAPLYRLKDINKVVENILNGKSKNLESASNIQKENGSSKSTNIKDTTSNYIKIKLKSNEILQGEFVEEDENILCLDSQKYRYLIYKNNILEKQNEQ